jgi:hypothetical protein
MPIELSLRQTWPPPDPDDLVGAGAVGAGSDDAVPVAEADGAGAWDGGAVAAGLDGPPPPALGWVGTADGLLP